MHEMSIAVGLLDQVLSALAGCDCARVETVELDVGELRQVAAEAMELAWRAINEGTPAEGSALKITEVEPVARCRACGTRFSPDIDRFLCPQCSQADVDILAGNDIILKTLTCIAGSFSK